MALALAAAGARVTLASPQTALLEEVAAQITKAHGPGRALAVTTDITRRDQCDACVSQTLEAFGNGQHPHQQRAARTERPRLAGGGQQLSLLGVEPGRVDTGAERQRRRLVPDGACGGPAHDRARLGPDRQHLDLARHHAAQAQLALRRDEGGAGCGVAHLGRRSRRHRRHRQHPAARRHGRHGRNASLDAAAADLARRRDERRDAVACLARVQTAGPASASWAGTGASTFRLQRPPTLRWRRPYFGLQRLARETRPRTSSWERRPG